MLSNINKRLLPMKVHYFLFNAGTGPVVPFLSVYMKQLNFSSAHVGSIYTTAQLAGMLTKPITGVIADRFECQRRIFLASILLCAISFLLFNFTPELSVTDNDNHNSTVSFICNATVTEFHTDSPQETDEAMMDQCQPPLMENSTQNTNCNLTCGALKESQWRQLISELSLNVSHQHLMHSLKADLKTVLIRFSVSAPTALIQMTSVVSFPIQELLVLSDESTLLMSGTSELISNPRCETAEIQTECSVVCDNSRISSVFLNSAKQNVAILYRLEFWSLLLLTVWTWVTQAACVSVGDAICFELLGDKPHKYGNQRVFGALGWGCITILTGLLIDYTSVEGDSKKNLSPAFYLAVTILILDFIGSLKIKYTQQKHSQSIFKDVGCLLANIRIVVFLVWCIAIGMCTGLMWQFQFWLVEDLAKAQGCATWGWIKTLQGLIGSVQTLAGEVPFFFFSGRILRRFGHRSVMSLIPLVIGVRFILYSVVTNPWYFVPIELLNGITFGLFYACMASYASIIAPKGTEATMQGFVGAIFEGVGVSLGSLIGGILFTTSGGSLTFRYFGYGALVVSAVHFLYQLCYVSGRSMSTGCLDDGTTATHSTTTHL